MFGNEKSLNNCFSGNTFARQQRSPPASKANGAARTKPRPNPGGGLEFVEYLLVPAGMLGEQDAANRSRATGPQETMPNPCREVPHQPAFVRRLLASGK